MRPTAIRILTDLAVLATTVIVLFYLSKALPGYSDYFRYAYGGLILAGGVLVARDVSRIVAVDFRSGLGKEALVLSNAIAVIGYIASAVASAAYLSFSPTALLAGAAFSGLVLGLALQPTLGSFFAGVLILLSGAVRPGSHVRILTWRIPFQWAFTPGYKYFSPDSVYAGYMGEVKEVGLFFTKIITEEGQMMKIPNTIIATDAAILSYTQENYFFNVRYEFPNRFDPEVVLLRVRELMNKYPVVNLFVNEQSDKEYYIIKAVLNAQEKDHALIKSDILTRIIRLHRELEEAEAKAASSASSTGKPS
ncbi:MAG TPA: mechanosensitive ion channel domain-containing protein [Nitrososphaerales archaeon]|nr:mechanosensitive ion channel domain-containing protein [Nitrososphaerales archaeon]